MKKENPRAAMLEALQALPLSAFICSKTSKFPAVTKMKFRVVLYIPTNNYIHLNYIDFGMCPMNIYFKRINE